MISTNLINLLSIALAATSLVSSAPLPSEGTLQRLEARQDAPAPWHYHEKGQGGWHDEEWSADAGTTSKDSTSDGKSSSDSSDDDSSSSSSDKSTKSDISTKTSSSSGSSSSSSGSGTTYTGRGTWYDAAGSDGNTAGACGQVHQNSEMVAALSTGLFGTNYSVMPWCGKKIKVTSGSKSVEVTIVDACPTCETADSVDFSQSAFEALSELSVGDIPISWQVI